MIRGINQQNIFSVDEENEKFIVILDKYHKKSEYEIYAYCLMSDHVHLLIKEAIEVTLFILWNFRGRNWD